jgi:hypothetical protein
VRGIRSATWRGLASAVAIAAVALAAAPSRADDSSSSSNGGSSGSSSSDWISSWFAMVSRTQAEQPHWMTPLVTVTPRLEQEFRYDQYFETLPSDKSLNNYGVGKGLEIIPAENFEVILGIPPYEQRDTQPSANAFGDWPALLVKYRWLSANEENGNYILSTFLQFSAPTGAADFTNNAYVIQPTIAGGKGWGIFDIQATIGAQFPVGGHTTVENSFGYPVVTNVTGQVHLWDVMWPEVELNDTWWPDGSKEGKNQLFVTPGVIFGRFPIYERLKLAVGAGYQFAVSPETPAYKNNVILTVRTPF